MGLIWSFGRAKLLLMSIVSLDQKSRRGGAKSQLVAFSRPELTRILGLYGQFVATGDWRDYAIDHLKDAAVFSVFRRSSDAPLYRIEKRPSLARKQGAWAVISMTGVILKRGHDLGQVLKVFDKQRLKLAD